MVHRDAKPTDVLLADDGRVLPADFGIAVQQDRTAPTTGGVFPGSLDHVAPERVRSATTAPLGDLCSLGATLHQAVDVTPAR